jgi:hypothetical protein
MTPDQATAEIAQIRGDTNHDWHHEGRPGFDAAHERVMQLYQRAHSSAEPSRDSGTTPPDENTRRPNIVDDGPHATPQTAAEALAIPPREFSESARAQGWTWDETKRAQAYTEAEAEDLLPTARRIEALIHELAGTPMPTAEETEDQLIRERGAARFDAEAARATEAWTLLERRLPAVAAELTRTGQRYHRRTFDELLALHTALYDATTPHGERRLRAKYRQWAESQTP